MAWRIFLKKEKFMKNQIAIQSDTFYICERLKEIDESYFLVYNFKNNKFEVHSSALSGNTYCLTVPYPVLDERTVFLVRKTRASNIDMLIKEMEEENEKKEKEQIKEAVDCLKEVIK